MPSKRVFFLVLLLLSFVVPVFAQGEDEDMPMADITNDEGGVQVIQGSVEYTVGFLTDFNRGDTSVVLIDNSLYVDRDFISPVPAAYQVIGEITSDVYVSPFTYQVNLPIMPRGEARDVDNDGEEDAGVVIMSVVGYTNFRGGPFWDTDYEYSTGFTSTQGSTDFEFRHDVVGGKMIIWAPDDEQGFPAGFGEDGFLFTEDDPIMRVPAGYSVVNLDDEPFTLDRSIVATVDLIEQEQSLQPADYTDLSYSEAFDALIEQMRNEYAFTELKGIDWDALYEEFAPRFAEAEENNDPVAYQFALRDFTWAIPDGHVGASLPLTNSAFFEETDGGLGIAIRELDDGRVIVNYLVEGGPAAEAGVELGAEIITINGQTVDERASEVNVWSAPFSLETSRRLQELRYVVRFPVGEQVELVFKNPGSDEEQTATLEAIAERESWSFSSINNGAAPDGSLPIEFEILDSGYAYVRINTFSEYPVLMFRLWEWIIDQLNANNVPGLIIDMRWNSGGYNLDAWFAGYFFDHEVVIGNDANYYTDIDDFFVDPVMEDRIIPPDDGRYYGGPIALLVSPACASACEFFSYNMTLEDRATVIGFYPTDGLGGNITPVYMPDDVYFQFTTGRALDAEGNIRLEGIGVVPDIVVPVTEETLFYEGDILLDTAIEHLNQATSIPITDGGAINVGDSVEGELVAGERVHYTWSVPAEGGVFDIVLSDESGQLDTVLNIYFADDLSAPAVSNDDADDTTLNSALLELEVPGGLELIIEVAGYGDAESGAYTLSITETGAAEDDGA